MTRKKRICAAVTVLFLCMIPLCMVRGKVNTEDCYLCGNAEQSMMDLYSRYDTIGVLDLQDWNVLDLRLKTCDENGKEILENSGNDTVYGNIDTMRYVIDSIPSRGMAEAEITFRESGVNAELLEKRLCDVCYQKVMNIVEDIEKSIPFCIVDFETLEVYSLQMQEGSYFVRDYRVEVEQEESKVRVQVYYLPKRT